MKVTYQDLITTVLAALVVAVTLAVTEGWAWPMLGRRERASSPSGFSVSPLQHRDTVEDMATRMRSFITQA